MMQDVLTEFGYQAGQLVNQALSQGESGVSGSSLQRIEQKLDSALSGAASGATITPATRRVMRESVLRATRATLKGREQQRGMNRDTGRTLTGIDHLQQSIRQILLIAVGTCTMRRAFGSQLLEMIGQPYNTTLVLQIYALTAEALRRGEPRFNLKQIVPKWRDIDEQAANQQHGILQLKLSGDYLGQSITVGVVL